MKNSLKKFWIKNRTKFILVSAIVLFIVGLMNFYFVIDITSQSNDECLWTPQKVAKDSVKIVFQFVKENGVTWSAGIREGDELIAIDGVRTYNTVTATVVLDKVHSGDYATYTVKNNGKVFDTKVQVKKLINFSGLATAMLAFLWLLVGFVVVMAKPEGKTQLLFYRIGIAAILYSTFDMLYRGRAVANPIFTNVFLLLTVDTIWTLGGFLFAFLLIRFFCIFPKENKLIKKVWFNRTLIIAPIALFIVATALKFLFVYRGGNDGLYNIIASFIVILVVFGFVTGLVLLFMSYIKLDNKRERTPIFVILVSYFIGAVALIYTNTLASTLAGVIFNNPQYLMPIFLIALLPVAFGYSISRYSLMDVSVVVKNTIVYGAATITLAAVYFIIIYVIGQSVSVAIGTEYQGIIAGVVFVVFAMVFQSTKDRFQNFLTEKFYPEQFNFEKGLLGFNAEIAGVVGRGNIYDSIQKLFVQSLRIQTFGLLQKNENRTFELVRHQGVKNTNLNINDEDPIIENYCLKCMVLGKKQVIERQDFKEILGASAEQFLAEEIYTIVPLYIQSNLVGLLLFGLKQSGSQFTGKDLDLLISAALQAAISIENARLYESETEKQKIERDLENARKIQETLLPKVFPNIERLDITGKMIPAMHVGGDYFDLIKISDKKLFVVVGDVSGKGLSASFYMSKLQTMIRLYCTSDKSPLDVLVEVNKNIYENIERGWFITVSLALFDLEKKIVSFCRAGHVPLMKVNRNTAEEYSPAGIGVGLDRGEAFDPSLEMIELPLKTGDIYYFYSDGVSELMNTTNELFGINRIKEFLIENSSNSSADIQANLMHCLNEFRGKTPQYDDITSLIIKVK
jgi:serine phosphatase RsbU (regulator of sigma subunit)